MKNKTSFLRWTLLVISALVILLVPALWGCDKGGGELKVPVDVKGASNVGSIGIELAYDSTVLEPLEVKTAELTGNSMMEYNVKIPGRVIIGIIDASGINGDGTLVTVSFNVVRNEGSSPLTLEKIEVHNANTLIDIPATVSAGHFVVEDNSITTPVLNLSP